MSVALDVDTGRAVLALKDLAQKVKGDRGMVVLALADAVQALGDGNMPAFDKAVSDARSYTR